MKKHIKIIALLFIVIASVVDASAAGKTRKDSFKVSGNCGMCKANIEGSLKVNGVEAAMWNPDTKNLQVKYDPAVISLEQIHHLVSAAGYDTDTEKADSAAYTQLEKCCQYRGKNKCDHD
ncbi:MAG: heavy-metal-associated domain-containing protein [Bacteroidetes bacterium]|nr:heavy-metal-associated domain-containing protein [Bacteroidota bacterium]